MSRALPIALAALSSAALLGAGCGRSTVTLDPQSELEVQVNGIALMDGGEVGFGGMFQQTCDFDTESGSVGKDYDAGPGLELVLDAAEDRAVAALDGALHELRQSAGDTLEGRSLGLDGVVHARLLEGDGMVVVRGGPESGCALAWAEGASLGPDLSLPDEACGPGFGLAVDRADGTALLGGRGGLWRAQGGGLRKIDGGRAELLAFDPELGRIFVGGRGGSALRALQPNGDLAWDAELDGELVGISALGAHAAALVALRVEGGLRLLALDADDGQVVGVRELKGVQATALVADATGQVAGVVSADRVRFFAVGAED